MTKKRDSAYYEARLKRDFPPIFAPHEVTKKPRILLRNTSCRFGDPKHGRPNAIKTRFDHLDLAFNAKPPLLMEAMSVIQIVDGIEDDWA